MVEKELAAPPRLPQPLYGSARWWRRPCCGGAPQPRPGRHMASLHYPPRPTSLRSSPHSSITAAAPRRCPWQGPGKVPASRNILVRWGRGVTSVLMSPSPLAGCTSTSRSSLWYAAIASAETGGRPTSKRWLSPTLWRRTLPSAVDAIEGKRAGDGACARPPLALMPTTRVTEWATRLYVSTTEHRDCGPFSCVTFFVFASHVAVTEHFGWPKVRGCRHI